MKKLLLLPLLALAVLLIPTARPSEAQQVISASTLVSNVTIPAGLLTSSSALVPADLTAQFMILSLQAPQAQLNDPANGFTFEIDRLDGDGVWREDVGFTWQGGLVNDKQGGLKDNPGAIVGWSSPPVGKQIRFVINNQQAITGVTVTDQLLN